MKSILAIAAMAACTTLASATDSYGSYGYGYGESPTYEIPAPSPVEMVAPYTTMAPAPTTTMPSEVIATAPAAVCVTPKCEYGDKQLCPIADSEFQAGVHPCCDDSHCSVCHYNGCNQCCPGTFKPSYAEACMPCCEYDANALMCSDFVGSQQCAEGFTLVKKGDLFVCE